MKFKKVAIILVVPLMIEFLTACCECKDDPFTNYYDYLAYYSHSEMLAYSIDNSGPFSQPPSNDSVNAQAYGIRVLLDRQEVIPEEPQLTARPGSFSLMPSAYAFQCYCPNEVYYEPAEVVDSIRITTLNAFDAFHPAGSDVSSYFLVLRHYGDLQTMEAFVNYIKYFEFDPEDQAIEFKALLMNAPDPDFPDNHGFTIKIFLSDGRVLEAETNEISLIQ